MSDSEDTILIADSSRFRTMLHFPDWSQIREVLSQMADRRFDSDQIMQLLGRFRSRSSSDRYSEKKSVHKRVEFEALRELYDEDLPDIFGRVAGFVLRKNDYEYPLLRRKQARECTFSKQSILFLMCSMALCLIPRQQYHGGSSSRKGFAYQLDFSYIFQSSAYKCKTVVEYLKKELGRQHSYKQQLSVRRVVVQRSCQSLLGEHGGRRMCGVRMCGDNESIEDYFGDWKVDFANRFIGGGALSSGCVQEEIMFANHPELFVTPLLCESMEDNEAILLIGFKKYACNKGYGYTTRYLGPELHQYAYDEHRRAKEYITAMDAIAFGKNAREQFKEANVKRELLKAYAGFKGQQVGRIVTGNWGCGAFGGELRIKMLIQWIACTMAGKEMLYCPFGSREKVYDKGLFERIAGETVESVYKSLMEGVKVCWKKSREIEFERINIYSEFNLNSPKSVNRVQELLKQNQEQQKQKQHKDNQTTCLKNIVLD